MIISGKNSVYEALNSDKTINKVLIAKSIHDEFSKKIVDLCANKKIRYDFVDRKILDKFSEHNQGYVAEITDFKYSTLEEILNISQNIVDGADEKENSNEVDIKNLNATDIEIANETKSNNKKKNESKNINKKKDAFIVLLDNIQDPHNFGSIIRVCECAGVDGIIIENRRSCVVNETVYKTSGGAVNHMKIAKVTNLNDTIKYLQKQNIWVYACEVGGKDIYESNLKGNIAVVVGSEGEGVSKLTKQICDDVLSLPMFGKVNSLNVSTATSVIVYEILRQRKN